MVQKYVIFWDGSVYVLEECRESRALCMSSDITPSPPLGHEYRSGSPLFLLFENSKVIADFDTKAVSKIDQKWRIVARRRSVKSISWNAIIIYPNSNCSIIVHRK